MLLTVGGRSVDSALGPSGTTTTTLPPTGISSNPPPHWKLGAHGWVAPTSTEAYLRASCVQRRPLGAPSHWGRSQRRKAALDFAQTVQRIGCSTDVAWHPRQLREQSRVEEFEQEWINSTNSFNELSSSSDVFSRAAKTTFGQTMNGPADFNHTFSGLPIGGHQIELQKSSDLRPERWLETTGESFRSGGVPPTLLEVSIGKQPSARVAYLEGQMKGALLYSSGPLGALSLNPSVETAPESKPKAKVRALQRPAPEHWRWKQLRPASLGLLRSTSGPVGIVLDPAHEVPVPPRKLAPATRQFYEIAV